MKRSVIFYKKKKSKIYNNNNSLYLYSAFLGTQSALHERGESPQPPPMCSIHLDDATAAIFMSEANGEIWPGCWGYTPTLFEGFLGGIFNDHRESGP